MAKSNKTQRLGRGLGALLPSEDIQSATDAHAEKLLKNKVSKKEVDKI